MHLHYPISRFDSVLELSLVLVILLSQSWESETVDRIDAHLCQYIGIQHVLLAESEI